MNAIMIVATSEKTTLKNLTLMTTTLPLTLYIYSFNPVDLFYHFYIFYIHFNPFQYILSPTCSTCSKFLHLNVPSYLDSKLQKFLAMASVNRSRCNLVALECGGSNRSHLGIIPLSYSMPSRAYHATLYLSSKFRPNGTNHLAGSTLPAMPSSQGIAGTSKARAGIEGIRRACYAGMAGI